LQRLYLSYLILFPEKVEYLYLQIKELIELGKKEGGNKDASLAPKVSKLLKEARINEIQQRIFNSLITS